MTDPSETGIKASHIAGLLDDPEVTRTFVLGMEWSRWLRTTLNGSKYDGTDRAPAVFAAFDLANEIHLTILISLGAGRIGSAYALIRPQFEALARGIWAVRYADAEAYNNFILGRDTLTADNLAKRINRPGDQFVRDIWAASKKTLDQFTHTSFQLLIRRLVSDPERGMKPAEFASVIRFSTALSALASIEIGRLIGRPEVASEAELMLSILFPVGVPAQTEGDANGCAEETI